MALLRNWWPGWRWAIVFIMGAAIMSASAAMVVNALHVESANNIQRQFTYCRSMGQPWVQISKDEWRCDMSAYWTQSKLAP